MEPLMALVPEVVKPNRKIPFREKLGWTAVALFIYLVCCQIPLYGIFTDANRTDPLFWLRRILASNQGSLMELGIAPIIQSGLIMNLLDGAKIITVNHSSQREIALFEGAQKLFGIVLILGQATMQVLMGYYGNPAVLGFGTSLLIVFQLMIAGLIVLLLDEILSKGYGFGSAITLFICVNTCEDIVWKAFSPQTLDIGRGKEFEGAIVNLFAQLITSKDKFRALRNAVFRAELPNLSQLSTTATIFLLVIYLQGFQIELPISTTAMRGLLRSYPIKLFYTSTMPIILQAALISNIFVISQLLASKFPNNFFVGLLGKWSTIERSMQPIGGLCYYISSPRSISAIFTDSIHVITYVTSTLCTCSLFAKTWVAISNSGPDAVYTMFKKNNIALAGEYRTMSMKKVFKKYILTAASLGGITVGILAISADLLDALGSGTGILLATATIYQYYESFYTEAEYTE